MLAKRYDLKLRVDLVHYSLPYFTEGPDRALQFRAEDEPAIRRGVSDALRLSGYDVTEASDGAVGYREAASGGIDLVLLDIMLPKRDGFSVLREVRVRGEAGAVTGQAG